MKSLVILPLLILIFCLASQIIANQSQRSVKDQIASDQSQSALQSQQKELKSLYLHKKRLARERRMKQKYDDTLSKIEEIEKQHENQLQQKLIELKLIEDQVTKEKSSCESKKSMIATKQIIVTAGQNELSQIVAQISSIEVKKQEASSQLKTIEQQQEQSKQSEFTFKSSVSQKREQISEITSSKKRLTAEITALQLQMNNKQSELDQITIKEQEYTNELHSMETQVTASATAVSSISKKILEQSSIEKGFSSQIDSLQLTKITVQGRIDQAQQTITSFQTDIRVCESTNTVTEERVKALREEIAILKQQACKTVEGVVKDIDQHQYYGKKVTVNDEISEYKGKDFSNAQLIEVSDKGDQTFTVKGMKFLFKYKVNRDNSNAPTIQANADLNVQESQAQTNFRINLVDLPTYFEYEPRQENSRQAYQKFLVEPTDPTSQTVSGTYNFLMFKGQKSATPTQDELKKAIKITIKLDKVTNPLAQQAADEKKIITDNPKDSGLLYEKVEVKNKILNGAVPPSQSTNQNIPQTPTPTPTPAKNQP